MRQREHIDQVPRPTETTEAAGGAAEAAVAAARFASAVENVSERILSGNSQAFLEATEQHGGQ
ncbi:MAG TPA: hypothetical protein VMT89_12085 [Candidatus Acidoferrales bacterium]|nr:hypothetical protein [Candidatus Acidoferrales bacterium]